MEQPNYQQEPPKPKGFVQTLLTHNTTIIAILLAIAAMIGNEFEQKEQEAYDAEQTIEDKQNAISDDIQNYDGELKELELKEDTTTEKYQALLAVYNARVDSLNTAEAEQVKQQEQTTKVLATRKDQNKKSETADLFFQISVLISSIGFTNKNKLLMYIATALTVVGIIYILMMLLT